ncbi:hypothetical protein [Chitinophaga filiformis]|uniref:Uncharacterized protein n=1 Tax=Chitinophaga filiformis TaxID=104663 RepID=A0A1G7I9X0_CHIFI|nr:hypothetical protein [Chitinophaga filiformis]SDF09547.1 hypothetical protein SAMN04488121_101772 [Chitinophaga filiformis]
MIMYRELEDYIYEYCEKFQTKNELMARKTLMYTSSTTSSSMLSAMRSRGWISEDPLILNMIADGPHELKRRVVERIWREHKDELPLNLCPKCNLIARTPLARQCRFCKHDWHSSDTAAK